MLRQAPSRRDWVVPCQRPCNHLSPCPFYRLVSPRNHHHRSLPQESLPVAYVRSSRAQRRCFSFDWQPRSDRQQGPRLKSQMSNLSSPSSLTRQKLDAPEAPTTTPLRSITTTTPSSSPPPRALPSAVRSLFAAVSVCLIRLAA